MSTGRSLHRVSSSRKQGAGLVAKRSVLACSVATLMAGQAQAMNWEFDSGLAVDLDTTLGYNVGWRMEDQDQVILNGGGDNTLAAVTDDGNRNFNKGAVIQNQLNFSSDLDIQYGDGGAFFRARGWYDKAYDDTSLEKKPFQRDGLNEHETKIELLDAFLYNYFTLGERNVSLRLGDQVVSWGESLFLPGGISTAQSPVDATKTNSAGVELKDVFMPIGQLYAEIDLTQNLFMGAYYQYDWQETRIDAPGSYFSVFDGIGVESVGDTLDIGVPVTDDKPDEGQWGVALRYMAESLNSTEFGLYYLRYNEFTPGLQLLPPVYGPQLIQDYFEDVDLIGLSFGTVVGDTNIGGEISYRDGKPVQLNIPGAFYFSEAKTAQVQFSAIHLIGNTPIADNLTILGEIAHNRVLSIDDDNVANTLGIDTDNVSSALDNDRSASSATVRLKADYFNVTNGLDAAITGAYRNDFNGVSSTAFTFTEGREELSLKADFSYLGGHSFGVGYSMYLTDPSQIVRDRGNLELGHLTADRDYVSAYYKYRF